MKEKLKKVHVVDIKWDTDGEYIPELPTETWVEVSCDDTDLMRFSDEITDALSDKYGFCIRCLRIPDEDEDKKPEENVNSHLEISRVLTISTAHVSKETAKCLDNAAELFCPSYPVIYKKGEYGWIIHVPEDELEYQIPEDLRRCMELARTNTCDWLCLDRDGGILRELPSFEW